MQRQCDAIRVESREIEDRIWDAVVIGTGAGGATAGFNLARLGHDVLFIERGPSLHDEADRGRVCGSTDLDGGTQGVWRDPLYRRYDNKEVLESIPLRCGTGGSTAIFSMLMDRFRPEDFTPGEFYRATSDASIPEAWPIGYETLRPFYDQAERLYGVRGTPDPLAPDSSVLLSPRGPSAHESALTDALSSVGLHPYRLHYACEQLADCAGCSTNLCTRRCRNTAAKMCLLPAVSQYNATLLVNCRVVRLDEEHRSISHAICDWSGKRIAVRGRMFVLAANAVETPALLQRSANDRYPQGLANTSGLVGRYLMWHASDFIALRLKSPSTLPADLRHGISLTDFYVSSKSKLGSIHAHTFFDKQSWPSPLVTVFATVVEDLPYATNRVVARGGADNEIAYRYSTPTELHDRSAQLLHLFASAVSSRFEVYPPRVAGQSNRSHICGTCRFGDDPRTSVLDASNRAHDHDNLYIVDASFFPTSGGINPSLTIAANSLRVSEIIARRL
jgi:choline dehydrogenase-like flavoprotein